MHETRIRFRNAGILGSAAVLACLASAAPASAQGLPVTYEATAVNLSNTGRTGMTQLQITVERWSDDAERDRLRDALIEKGDDALLKAVQKIKPRAGFIRTNTSLGWDIQYARRTELPEGGHRVVFATDRPMNFGEVARNARSADYDFMLAEFHIKADGKGEGKLVPRAKIRYNKDAQSIEIEDYATQPVRLTQIIERSSK